MVLGYSAKAPAAAAKAGATTQAGAAAEADATQGSGDEMQCCHSTALCTTEWGRYSFDEGCIGRYKDWKEDPFAEDGVWPAHRPFALVALALDSD